MTGPAAPAPSPWRDAIVDLLPHLPAGQVHIWLARCADEVHATQAAGVLPMPASSFDTLHEALRGRGIPSERASAYLDRVTDEVEAADRQVCCVCGSPAVVYRNYQEKPFCSPCAEGNTPR